MMNRKQRRAQRKLGVGTVIRATTFAVVDHVGRRHLYWFEEPEGSPKDGLPPGVTVHGPFETDAEVKEHQRLTLLGPQCKVTEGRRVGFGVG